GTHRVLAMDVTLAPRDPRAPGQFGNAVAVPAEKQEEAKSRWKEGNFNVYLSDLIPVDRAIADTRPAGCSEQRVHDDLPTTSVIMCFVDEVWSTLLRSVHSVLSRSPPRLLRELILVDDCSSKGRWPLPPFPNPGCSRQTRCSGQCAMSCVGSWSSARSHAGLPTGLLPHRRRAHIPGLACGCRRERGSALLMPGPPLSSYMTVDNFQRGVFTWPMNFGWRQIPQEVIEKNRMKETDVIRCPVMAGGLFSIDRSYFFELGTYDPGLEVWGGENMELSFKVGGPGPPLEIIPCSRVGHIFRNDNPYSFPKDRISTVERNLARVAEVWLDEYKDLFYGHAYHLILKNLDVGNLTQQMELRKKLKCKSFKWYLENVYPDLEAPLVRSSGLVGGKGVPGCTAATLSPASVQNQHFNYTWLRLLQHGDVCVAPGSAALALHPCDGRDPRLKWLHMSLAARHPGLTEHVVAEQQGPAACLDAHPAPRLGACDPLRPQQKWRFANYHVD
ncbi:GALT5 acetylgalactosaminyltransferase, partial [Eudromia elegans]|nr:GALT5 acetylgalactosaminyltransferase [Eudromia elegans]